MHTDNTHKHLRTTVKNNIISHMGNIYWETAKENRRLVHSVDFKQETLLTEQFVGFILRKLCEQEEDLLINRR